MVGALGSVSKQLKTYNDVIGIPNIIGSAQMSTITKIDRILRDVYYWLLLIIDYYCLLLILEIIIIAIIIVIIIFIFNLFSKCMY